MMVVNVCQANAKSIIYHLTTMTDPKDIRPTPTIEDYLIILYVLERDHEPAIAARLAEIFEVAPPTVTMTLKRMTRDGWIRLDRVTSRREGSQIRLTDSGREAARSVMRRHMLMEWMLYKMLKVPWSLIHTEAHLIEHAISDEVETRLSERFDEYKVCPHGNPFPGFEHVTRDWLALTELIPGQQAVIRRVHEMVEDRPDLLTYMEKNGILPGIEFEVIEVLPFNQTLTIKSDLHQVTFGFNVARRIYAEFWSGGAVQAHSPVQHFGEAAGG